VSFVPKTNIKGNNMPNEVDPTISFFSKYSEAQIKSVFGKGSSSLLAHQVQQRSPQEYLEMKITAVYRDRILGPESLPLNARLTKDQLEQKYRADRAAAQDDLIPLNAALAARLGVPENTKVSWDTFQRLMGRKTD